MKYIINIYAKQVNGEKGSFTSYSAKMANGEWASVSFVKGAEPPTVSCKIEVDSDLANYAAKKNRLYIEDYSVIGHYEVPIVDTLAGLFDETQE